MAGITYLIRMLPLVLVKKKIKNRFITSFLYYVPYSVLSVMTIPAIFYAADHMVSAAVGFAAAFVLAWHGKSLVQVAAVSCLAVLLTEILVTVI